MGKKFKINFSIGYCFFFDTIIVSAIRFKNHTNDTNIKKRQKKRNKLNYSINQFLLKIF